MALHEQCVGATDEWWTEQWRSVPSLPGYFASSLGRIKGPRGVVKPTVNREGYLYFAALLTMGKYNNRRVNRVVCEAFHGLPPSPKHEAAHWDGKPTNNASDNLRWATSKENHSDKKRHGTSPALERHPHARFSENDVREIKRVYAQRLPGGHIKRGVRERLAQRFGVKASTINDVVRGRTWASVQIDPAPSNTVTNGEA